MSETTAHEAPEAPHWFQLGEKAAYRRGWLAGQGSARPSSVEVRNAIRNGISGYFSDFETFNTVESIFDELRKIGVVQ